MKSVTKTNLTKEQIESLVKKHFPEEKTIQAEELTEGMFNAAYLVTGDAKLRDGAVLKVGPGADTEILTYEKDIMKTEIKVYQMLQDQPVPTPKILASDVTGEDISSHYFFMERLKGNTWKSYEKKLTKELKAGLMYDFGGCNAAIHRIEGGWFGYIKDDKRFQFDSWGEAFCSMMHDICNDGKARNYRLPYEEVERITNHHKTLLNQITVPKLVDFDMWSGNIFLDMEKGCTISGIVDFERSFYGDPYADFTSALMIFDDVENEPDFCRGYVNVSGRELTVTEQDRIRMDLYRLYMAMIMGVEVYRYNKAYGTAVQTYVRGRIKKLLKGLNK